MGVYPVDIHPWGLGATHAQTIRESGEMGGRGTGGEKTERLDTRFYKPFPPDSDSVCAATQHVVRIYNILENLRRTLKISYTYY